MTREDFERRITDLLPDVSDQAMKSWLEYAKSLDRDGTETESEIFDRSYVELALIKRHQGVETAAALFNYGEKFVFNYFELRGAAEFLKEGWPLERISDHAVENGCDPTLEAMEESHAALEEFQSGKWDTRENKRKFSSDLSQGIRQFYALEQGLGGQDGTFSEWIRAAYEINEDFDQSFAEVVSGLCGAFHDTDAQYGRDISRQLYNTLAVVLPAEIRSAAPVSEPWRESGPCASSCVGGVSHGTPRPRQHASGCEAYERWRGCRKRLLRSSGESVQRSLSPASADHVIPKVHLLHTKRQRKYVNMGLNPGTKTCWH